MSESQKSSFIQALSNFSANAIENNEAMAGQALPCHVVAVSDTDREGLTIAPPEKARPLRSGLFSFQAHRYACMSREGRNVQQGNVHGVGAWMAKGWNSPYSL